MKYYNMVYLARKTIWAQLRHRHGNFALTTAANGKILEYLKLLRLWHKYNFEHVKKNNYGIFSVGTATLLPRWMQMEKTSKIIWAQFRTSQKNEIFATFPIGTAIFTLRSVKSTFSYEFSYGSTSNSRKNICHSYHIV